MKPFTYVVVDLFSAPQRYVIPIYQRRYVWSRDKQWAPLWDDIRARAERVHAQERGIQPHFLGAVVVARRETFGHQVTAYDVIDGQQRLTTFQLFLAAFRDALGGRYPMLEQELTRLLTNDGLKASEEERFKVWPTRFDQDTYTQAVEARDPEAARTTVEQARQSLTHVPNLLAAYSYFHDELREWLGADADLAPRADALLMALRKYLQVVRIDLEEEDDPQVIFETLNARGEPLQPADLVRNHIFNDAARSGEDVEALFRTSWAPFDADGSFWRKQASRGRVTRDQLTWFLTAFLTVQHGRDVTDHNIFDEFKRWWRTRTGTVADALDVLTTYAGAYHDLMHAPVTSRLGAFRRRLEAMDLNTLTPLLLWLQTRGTLEEQELHAVIGDLESFTVRRFILGLGSKNYNLFFLQVLQALMTGAPVHETVRAMLLRGSGESVRWPGDDEVYAELVTAPTYRRLRPGGVRMLLEALEEELTTTKQEQVIFTEPATVEHVLPQRWRKHWPAPADQPGIADASAWRDQRLQNLGNLTLIRGTLNSSVSNKPYDLKRPALAEQSTLRLNTVFQTQLTWDEAVIEARAQDLATRLLKVWPVPVQVDAPQAGPAVPVSGGSFDELFSDLLTRPPHRSTVKETATGVALTIDTWWSAYKFLVTGQDTPDGERARVEFREEFPENDERKPKAEQVMLEVGGAVQLQFNEFPVTLTPSSVTIEVAGDATPAQVRRVLERLMGLAFRARAFRAGSTGQYPELDAAATAAWPLLPAAYYVHGTDQQKGRLYQRIPNVRWPAPVHYELGWAAKTRRVQIQLDVELDAAEPARVHLLKAWPDITEVTRRRFPDLPMDGKDGLTGKTFNLKLTCPEGEEPAVTAARLAELIALTETLVSDALHAVKGSVNEAAPTTGEALEPAAS